MADKLEGKFIIHRTEDDRFAILKERNRENLVYDTVIPDAGWDRAFAYGLVALLNAQGSEAGETSEGETEEKDVTYRG